MLQRSEGFNSRAFRSRRWKPPGSGVLPTQWAVFINFLVTVSGFQRLNLPGVCCQPVAPLVTHTQPCLAVIHTSPHAADDMCWLHSRQRVRQCSPTLLRYKLAALLRACGCNVAQHLQQVPKHASRCNLRAGPGAPHNQRRGWPISLRGEHKDVVTAAQSSERVASWVPAAFKCAADT